MLALTALGCGPTSFLITPVSAEQTLQENVVTRESVWAFDKIAIVDVDGVIRNGRDTSLTGVAGENPVSLFREKLDRAARDNRVKAVLVRINSPGGTVTGSELMYTELCRFREQTKKPAYACMMDLGASGGYYLACGAERIFAHPTTITGSIGVIMMLPELTGTMRKLGVEAHIFKSGAMKDAGSLFREMNDADRALFEKLTSEMYQRFFDTVQRERGIAPERLRELADGRVYLGPDAKANGLVDEVGTIQDAIVALKDAAGLAKKKVLVVEYSRPLAHRPNVYAQTGAAPAQVNLINVELPMWLRGDAPQFLYFWAPGW